MKKHILVFLLVLIVSASMLASTPYYDVGSQIFTISAGTNVPLTASADNNNGSWKTLVGVGKNGTHSSMGGYGSLDYEVFVNPYISIGGELGYQFNFGQDKSIFSQVPMLFKLSYVPLQGSIEIPISLGAGLNYMSYKGESKINLMAQLTFGARYFFNEEWGLGLNTGLTVVPEFHSDSVENGLITFVPINIAVSYRH